MTIKNERPPHQKRPSQSRKAKTRRAFRTHALLVKEFILNVIITSYMLLIFFTHRFFSTYLDEMPLGSLKLFMLTMEGLLLGAALIILVLVTIAQIREVTAMMELTEPCVRLMRFVLKTPERLLRLFKR